MKNFLFGFILALLLTKILYDTFLYPLENKEEVVNSISDLILLDPTSHSKIVYVTNKQGGYFKYNPSKAKENNHCTIFNGWERQTQESNINIMWCGAIGDGKTDDTVAFHNALEASYRYRRLNRGLYLPTGSYRITKKIVIPSTYDGKINNAFTIYGDGSFDAGQTQIYFEHPATGNKNDPIEFWINSKILGLTLKDIRFKQIYPKGKNIYSFTPYGLLKAKATNGEGKNTTVTADTDTAIMNCTFSRFYTIVENWGRGLRFTNNTASLSHNPIVLEWDTYPESPKGIGRDKTGFRAFNITANRFHSNGGFAITNVGLNAHKIHSILISDSLMDIGRGIFKGVLVDGTISNTVSIMTPTTVIDLHNGSKNYQVLGLTASGNNDVYDGKKERIPSHFIILRGNHANAQFSNLNLSNCTGDAILSIDGRLNGIAFNNITMDKIGDSSSDGLFYFADYPHRVSINNLLYSGKRKLLQPIKVSGTQALINISNYFSPNSDSLLYDVPQSLDTKIRNKFLKE